MPGGVRPWYDTICKWWPHDQNEQSHHSGNFDVELFVLGTLLRGNVHKECQATLKTKIVESD